MTPSLGSSWVARKVHAKDFILVWLYTSAHIWEIPHVLCRLRITQVSSRFPHSRGTAEISRGKLLFPEGDRRVYDEKFLIGFFIVQSLDDRPAASFRGGYIAIPRVAWCSKRNPPSLVPKYSSTPLLDSFAIRFVLFIFLHLICF